MTTTTAPKNGAGVAEGAAPTPAPEGLYEKLAAISALAQVKATGQTQQGKTVFSIGDVEAEIGRLCATAGVVTRWSSVSLDSYEQATSNGVMRMWISHLRVKVTDAKSGESFEDDWIDIGTNPMAAASFVRKGYYKALFHLAEGADEGTGEAPAQGGGQQATARAASGAARPATGIQAPVCTQCEMAQYRSKNGGTPRYYPSRKEGYPAQCNGVDAEGEYQNHSRRTAPQPEPQLTGVGAAVREAADQTTPDDGPPLFP